MVFLPRVLVTVYVAILREVQYKGWAYRDIKKFVNQCNFVQ